MIGNILRTIKPSVDEQGFEIIITVKKGYVWLKTPLDIKIDVIKKEITDNEGDVIFKWEERQRSNKHG